MIGLLQRVRHARVDVQDKTIAEIGAGLLVLVGMEKNDDEARATRLLERLLSYRVFADEQDKMNLSLLDTGGGLLLVPQFTLAANTKKGTRPSFSEAAPPGRARELFHALQAEAESRYDNLACGEFAADMQVSLVNDGPVTFLLQV